MLGTGSRGAHATLRTAELADMENMENRRAPHEASAALHQAEAARSALAARLEVTPWSLGLLGLAVAAQIVLTAAGLGQDHGRALHHV